MKALPGGLCDLVEAMDAPAGLFDRTGALRVANAAFRLMVGNGAEAPLTADPNVTPRLDLGPGLGAAVAEILAGRAETLNVDEGVALRLTAVRDGGSVAAVLVQPGCDGAAGAAKDSPPRGIPAADRRCAPDARLRALAENLPAALFHARSFPDGSIRYEYFNAQLADLLGVPAQAIEENSHALLAHMPPEDQALMRATMERCLETMAPGEFTHRVEHPTRGLRWVSSFAAPSPGPDGAIEWHGHSIHVTERVEGAEQAEQAERQMRLTEERLRIATGVAGIGVWDYDIPSNRVQWDASMHRLYHVPPGAFEDAYEGWRSRVHPEDVDAAEASLASAIERLEPFAAEFRILRDDGTERHIKAAARILTDENGKALRAVGLNIDITELREAERRAEAAAAEVHRAHTRLNRLTDNAPGALFEYREEADGTITFPYFSAGLPPITGVAADAIAADATAAFANIPREDLRKMRADIGRARARLGPFTGRFRLDHPERGERWVRASARPFSQEDGGVLWYGNLLDVTEETEAERARAAAAQALEHAHHRLSRLVEKAPAALFEYHEDGEGRASLPYFTANLPDLFDVPAAEILRDGSQAMRNIHPDDVQMVTEALARSRADLGPMSLRYRITLQDGGLRWLQGSARPFRQEDGTTLWYGNIFDVSDQAEAERQRIEYATALGQANARLHHMANNAPAAVFEYREDAEGHVTLPYFSANLPRLLGVEAEAVRRDASTLFTHFAPEDVAVLMEKISRSRRELTPLTMRFHLDLPDGGRWIVSSSNPIQEQDGAMLWYVNCLDVTEQTQAEMRARAAAEELASALRRQSSIANIAPAGIYEFRRAPDGTVDFPYFSDRFAELFGVARAQIEGDPDAIFALVLPEDLPEVLRRSDESARTMGPYTARFRTAHPERGVVWLNANASPASYPDGTIVWTGALVDVTEDVARETDLRRAHREAEAMRAENERQALHDGLTGLANRRAYDNLFSERLAAAAETGDGACVLIRIDLDRFKHVNDTLGHEAGDAVLLRVAEMLRATLRPGDLAARVGGDEFSILMGPGATEADARSLVERLQSRLAEPLLYADRQCRFGASFGIARVSDFAAVGADLNLFADAALYRAKDAGRNRMEFFTPGLHRQILRDRQLAIEVQEGLDREEFVPFFQPQVAAEDHRLVGAEVLLRWNHPREGLLAPDRFMHVAEQLRLVPDIDAMMMRKAQEALRRWTSQGLFLPRISFNVSSGRVHDGDVVSVARALAAGGTQVAFELLESILVEKEDPAFHHNLDRIREVGVEIEIDDFGSGHASIVGLMQIAPNALKIDKRIVAPLCAAPASSNLVRAIIEMAETLHIATVAEGVETAEQAQILRDLGCDRLQGYFFSRPLPELQFKDFASSLGQRSA